MTIIQIEPLPTGQHPIQSQSGRSACWLDGYIEVPTHLESAVWDTLGWCDLQIENGKLVGIMPTEQPEPGPDILTEAKDAKQEENKAALAQWLVDHPLTWTDGKQYGVEEQDQNEMALNLMQYQAAQLASQVAPLEWHAQKEACREFTQEEYIGLSMAISNYVYPYRRYQESVKEAIYAAETMEELEAVVIDYSSVSNV